MTVNRAGSDTIDNALTTWSLGPDDSLVLIGNGTNWSAFSGGSVLAVNAITTSAGTTAGVATDEVVVFTGTTTHAYTLPACSTGRELRLKNRSAGAVTVNRAGSDTIDSAGTSLTLNTDDSVILVGNGTNWMVF